MVVLTGIIGAVIFMRMMVRWGRTIDQRLRGIPIAAAHISRWRWYEPFGRVTLRPLLDTVDRMYFSSVRVHTRYVFVSLDVHPWYQNNLNIMESIRGLTSESKRVQVLWVTPLTVVVTRLSRRKP